MVKRNLYKNLYFSSGLLGGLQNLLRNQTLLILQVSLVEGTAPNVKVVQVNATDADAGVNAAITYSLSLAPSNDFYIDSRTGNYCELFEFRKSNCLLYSPQKLKEIFPLEVQVK